MYHATVHRIKRGIFGPKHVKIYDKISPYPEPLMAELSKYDDDWHVTSFVDLTESHGNFDDRVPAEATAWDAATGEPVEDERDRPGYHTRIADHYADSAHGMDDDLPF